VLLKDGAASGTSRRSGQYELTGASTRALTCSSSGVGAAARCVRAAAMENCTAPPHREVCESSSTSWASKKLRISSEKGPWTKGRIESVKQYNASVDSPKLKMSE